MRLHPVCLGLDADLKQLQEGTGLVLAEENSDDLDHLPHIMLSYDWSCQQGVMLMKAELQKAGYKTWMDIDKMSGETVGGGSRPGGQQGDATGQGGGQGEATGQGGGAGGGSRPGG